jgi:hypothetical protein
VIRGFFNTKEVGEDGNTTYFLIHMDDDALNYWAAELKLVMFNKEK